MLDSEKSKRIRNLVHKINEINLSFRDSERLAYGFSLEQVTNFIQENELTREEWIEEVSVELEEKEDSPKFLMEFIHILEEYT